MSAMYTSTFTFAKGRFGDKLHAMDAEIAQIAKSIPGDLGEAVWENPTTGPTSNGSMCMTGNPRMHFRC